MLWAKIRHLRHFIQNLLGVKVHTSCKISKLVDTSDAQKPMWAKFLAFDFFLSEKARL